MLSRNLKINKRSLPSKSGKRKWIISGILIFSLFFIGYGFYTFQKLQPDDGQKAEVKVETGDRPLDQKLAVYVTNADNGLSLRKSADKNSERLDLIPNKTKLETLAELGGWYKVSYKGKEGWISKEFTTTKAPATVTDPAKSWSYYTSTKYGYKIKYPLGWKYQDYGAIPANQTLSMIAFSSQALPTKIPTGSDFIAPVTVEVSSKTLVQANKSFSTISGVVATPVTISSIPATKYTYTSVLSNTQMTGIVFSAGGKTFILNEGGGYSEDLLKMANTFTIGG